MIKNAVGTPETVEQDIKQNLPNAEIRRRNVQGDVLLDVWNNGVFVETIRVAPAEGN